MMEPQCDAKLSMSELESAGSTTATDVLEINYREHRYRFMIPNQPDYILNTIASTHTFYEIEMLEDIRRRVGPKDLVLDIGSHVGNHTIYLAGACGCEVLAFEPFQENFAMLNANIALNSLGALVQTFAIALAASSGHGVARLRDVQNRGSVAIDEVPHASGIPIKPLDDIKLSRDPAALKIDVEGTELEVLEGAQSLLRRCRPLLYLETIDDEAFETVARFLDGFGYQALACFNATPTFLFATSDNPRVSGDERRLDRLFGRSCIRHRSDLRDLRAKVREVQHDLSETKARLESSRTKLAEKAEKLQQTNERLRETNKKLRRTRRWLKKMGEVAGRRKRGPVYRIRRALATTRRGCPARCGFSSYVD